MRRQPEPVFHQPFGLEAQSEEYSLRCLCHSAPLRLALGGQPFSISNDVPQKSVSRATGVPNTRGSFARRVFYLHFPVSLRGCRLIQTSRGGECERVVEGEKKRHLDDVRVCQPALLLRQHAVNQPIPLLADPFEVTRSSQRKFI